MIWSSKQARQDCQWRAPPQVFSEAQKCPFCDESALLVEANVAILELKVPFYISKIHLHTLIYTNQSCSLNTILTAKVPLRFFCILRYAFLRRLASCIKILS